MNNPVLVGHEEVLRAAHRIEAAAAEEFSQAATNLGELVGRLDRILNQDFELIVQRIEGCTIHLPKDYEA